jgi:hypothetical protein
MLGLLTFCVHNTQEVHGYFLHLFELTNSPFAALFVLRELPFFFFFCRVARLGSKNIGCSVIFELNVCMRYTKKVFAV